MRAGCLRWLGGCGTLLLGCLAHSARAESYWVTVAGLGGEPDYEQRFSSEASDVERTLKGGAPETHVQTLSGAEATRARVTAALRRVARQSTPADDFVLLLIGHGSFDGVAYKLNLPGADISARELAQLCDEIPAHRQLIINTSSASGGSLATLERRGRAVIVATKSGTEKNATVFARYWLEALQDAAADLDKSDSISALEAFEYAARKTADFYRSQKRLATEHPVFEDAGHGAPVRDTEVGADAAAGGAEGRLLAGMTLIRLGSARAQALDPAKRAQLAHKEQLLQQIDALKLQKAALADSAYQTQLKALLIELARTQAALDR